MNPNKKIGFVLIKGDSVETETDQTMKFIKNTENRQENGKQNADQLELPLNLTYSKRNLLITNLNDLSAILKCKKAIPEDAKQRICKKIDESIRILVELSSFKSSHFTNASGVFEEMVRDRLIVDLPKAESLRVVGHLMTVRDAVQFDRSTTGETKQCLVDESKQIVDQLMNLACREQSDESDDEEKNDEVGEQQIVNTGISSTVAEINRTEGSFKVELAITTWFFERNGNEQYSDPFWLRGMPWMLHIKHNSNNGRFRVTDVFLGCYNDDSGSWSCKVNAELILFGKDSSKDKRWHIDYTFKRTETIGGPCSIYYSELKDDYIKDNKIVIGVNMTAGPVIRT